MAETTNKVILKINGVETGTQYTTIKDALDAISLDNTADAKYTVELAGTFAEDVTFLKANFAGNKYFSVDFVKAADADAVIAGTIQLGYYQKKVGGEQWDGSVTFTGITFDHAEAEKDSLSVQNIKDKGFAMTDCTVIGDGTGYGIHGVSGGIAFYSSITGGRFVNATLETNGNLGTGLLVEGVEFKESNINIPNGGEPGVTISECSFSNTLTDAYANDSFYVVRSSNVPVTIKDCTFDIDSTASASTIPIPDDAQSQNGGKNGGSFAVFCQRADYAKAWDVQNITVNFTDAALANENLQLSYNAKSSADNGNENRVVIAGLESSNDVADLLEKTNETVIVKETNDAGDVLYTTTYADGVKGETIVADGCILVKADVKLTDDEGNPLTTVEVDGVEYTVGENIFNTINDALDVIKNATDDAGVKYTIQLDGTFNEDVLLNWSETNDVTFTKAAGAAKAEITGRVQVGDTTSHSSGLVPWKSNLCFDKVTFDYTAATAYSNRFELRYLGSDYKLQIDNCIFNGPGLINANYGGNDEDGNLFSSPWKAATNGVQGLVIVKGTTFNNGNISLWRNSNKGEWLFDDCDFNNAVVSLKRNPGKTGYKFDGCDFVMDLDKITKDVPLSFIICDDETKGTVVNSTMKVTGDATGKNVSYITTQNPNGNGADKVGEIILEGMTVEGAIPEGVDFYKNLSGAESNPNMSHVTEIYNKLDASDLTGVTAADLNGAANVEITNTLEDGTVQKITSDAEGVVNESLTNADKTLYLNGESYTADLEYKAIKAASGTSKITDADVNVVGLQVGSYSADENITDSATLELSGVNVVISGEQGTDSSLWIGDTLSGADYKGTYKLVLKDGSTIRGVGSVDAVDGQAVQGAAIRKDGVLEITEGSSVYLAHAPIKGEVIISDANSKLTVQAGNLYSSPGDVASTITVEEGGTFRVAHHSGSGPTASNTFSLGGGENYSDYKGQINLYGGTLEIGERDIVKVYKGSTIEVNGGAIDGKENSVINLTNGGILKVTGKDASTVKATITGKALELAGTLDKSDVNGGIKVVGNGTIQSSKVGNVYVGINQNLDASASTGYFEAGYSDKANTLTIKENVTSGRLYIGCSNDAAATAKVYIEKEANVNVIGSYIYASGELHVKGNITSSQDISVGGKMYLTEGATWTQNWEGRITKDGVLSLNDSSATLAGIWYVGGYSESNTGGTIQLANGASIKFTGSKVITRKDYNITINDSSFTANVLNHSGDITMDADSLLTAGSITGDGVITIDANGFDGVKKVVDITGAGQEWADGQLVFTNLGETQVAYGADGDVVLANVDTKTLYVNSAWADSDPNTDGNQPYAVGDAIPGTDGKLAYGFNAFASINDAIKAAEKNGGATIDLTTSKFSGSEAGLANATLFQTNGTYTFTGGDYIDFAYVDTPRPTDENAGKVSVNIVFDKAKVTAGKFRLDNGSSLEIKDSYIDAQSASGASTGWTTFYGDSTITVENSVIGWYTTTQTMESDEIVAGDQKTNYLETNGLYVGRMCYCGSGVMTVTNSTVFTYPNEGDAFSLAVYDKGLMSFTNSAVYAYSLAVGGAGNKTVGRDYEVATMSFKNSTLRTTTTNGTSTERIVVGGANEAELIFDNSTVEKSAAAMTVESNGTVNMTDSKFEAAKVDVDKDGEFNVMGKNTLTIDNVTGTITAANGATLVGSKIGGAGVEVSNSRERNYVLSVNGDAAGTIYFENGKDAEGNAVANTIASLDARKGDKVVVKGTADDKALLNFSAGDGFRVGKGATWEIENAKITANYNLAVDNEYGTENVTTNFKAKNSEFDLHSISAKGSKEFQEIGNGTINMEFENSTVNFNNKNSQINLQKQDVAQINLTFKDSEITGTVNRFVNDAEKGVVTFDNTNLTAQQTFRNAGTVYIKNNAEVKATVQYDLSDIEKGSGNTGIIDINNAKLELTGDVAFANSGTITATNATIDIDKLTNNGTFTATDASITAGTVTNSGSITVNGGTFTADAFVQNSSEQAVFNNVVMDVNSLNTGDNAWVVVGGKSKVMIDELSGGNAVRFAAGTTLLDGTSIEGLGVRSLGALTVGEKATDTIYTYHYDTTRASVGTITVNGEWKIGKNNFGIATWSTGDAIKLTGSGTVNVDSQVFFEGYAATGSNYTVKGNILVDEKLTINMVNEGSVASHLRFSATDVTIKGIVANKGTWQNMTALYEADVIVTGNKAKLDLAGYLTIGNVYYIYDNTVTDAHKSSLTVSDGASVNAQNVFVNLDSKINVNNATFGVSTIDNNGTITISGTSTVNAAITGSGKVELAYWSTLNGNLKAETITVNGYAMLDAEAAIDAKLVDGTLAVGGSANAIKLTYGTTTVLQVADQTVFDSEDTLGGAKIQGAYWGVTFTVNNANLTGNTVAAGAFVNITDVNDVNDGFIEIDADVTQIKSINGFTVEKLGDMYYYIDNKNTETADDDVTMLISARSSGVGFDITQMAKPDDTGAGTVTPDADPVATDLNSMYIDKETTALANSNIEMAAGYTSISTGSGAWNEDKTNNMDVAFGSIQKDEKGGINDIYTGSNVDMDINGDIESMGNVSVGANSTLDVREDMKGQNNGQSVYVGYNADLTAKNIDLKGGWNSLTVDYKGDLDVDGDVKNVASLGIYSGVDGKEATIGGDFIAPLYNNNIDVGYKASLTITRDIVNGVKPTDPAVYECLGTGTYISVGYDADFAVTNIYGLSGMYADGESTVTVGGYIHGTMYGNSIYAAGESFSAGNIDLKGGWNSFTTGYMTEATVASFTNVSSISTGWGGDLTVTGDITGVQSLNIAGNWGDMVEFSVAGAVTAADWAYFYVGSYVNADFEAGITFGTTYDSLNIGSSSDVDVTGSIVNVDSVYVGWGSSMDVNGNITGVQSLDIAGNWDVRVSFSAADITTADWSYVGIGSFVDAKIGNITFGTTWDTMNIGYKSTVEIGTGSAVDFSNLDALYADATATLKVNNGKGNDVDLSKVGGWWQGATILDEEGELAAAGVANTGSVYANEWDVYEIDSSVSSLSFKSSTNGIVIEISQDNGVTWDEYKPMEGQFEIDAVAGNLVRVGVTTGFNDETKKASYSFELLA